MLYDTESLIKRGKGRASELPRRLGVSPEALKGARVLEIGCGFGETTFSTYDTYGAKALGIDPRPRFLKSPWHKLGLYRELEIEQLKGEDEQFDFMQSYTVWEHIERPRDAIVAAYKLMKPGGRAYFNFNLYLGPSASHLNKYLNMPWVHLLHSDEEIRAMMLKKHNLNRGPAWVNKLSAVHYQNYFAAVGFKILKVWYDRHAMPPQFYSEHYEKLKGLPKEELELNFMHVCLEKPAAVTQEPPKRASPLNFIKRVLSRG
ncbi:MAG TPA: class I SAM-dependent methyltransferase [Rhizomicrobium sp.]|jgi:SAM-dependent methyltransferase